MTQDSIRKRLSATPWQTILILSAWASGAHAQEQASKQGRGDSPSSANHVVLGVGVATTPAYQGSEDYRVLPLPAIDIKHGWFFANLRNGIGIAPIDTGKIAIGASVVFVQGYRKKDVPAGIDRLPDGVGARLFTTVRAGGFIATLGAVKIVSGGIKGLIADLSLSYPVQLSPRFTLAPSVGATWANETYNNRYFGISMAESLAAGLPRFSAGAGFKDVSGALTASYRLTNRISLSATANATTLLGKVKDSPIVEKNTAPFGILTLSYRL